LGADPWPLVTEPQDLGGRLAVMFPSRLWPAPLRLALLLPATSYGATPGSELYTHPSLDVMAVILDLYSLELRIVRGEVPIAGE